MSRRKFFLRRSAEERHRDGGKDSRGIRIAHDGTRAMNDRAPSNADANPPGTDARARWAIISYFAILNLALGLGSPLLGIAAIPISYFLKDNLRLSPMQLAFR